MGPSLSVMRIIFAPLLLHSLILDSIRFNFSSEGTIAITGDPAEISAIGPCFNSPPGRERHGMYDISIIFSAPSFAIYDEKPPLPIKIGGSEFRIRFVASLIESSIYFFTNLGKFRLKYLFYKSKIKFYKFW